MEPNSIVIQKSYSISITIPHYWLVNIELNTYSYLRAIHKDIIAQQISNRVTIG